jgi:hypothetical protein
MELRFAYFSIIKGLFIYLTPFIPLSMIWIYIPIMRGRELKRGAVAPLGHPVFNFVLRFNYPLLFRRVLERRSLSFKIISPSLVKGGG